MDVITHALSAATTAALEPGSSVVGVTWRSGSGTVQVRWRTATWSAWSELDRDSGADADTAEARRVRPGTEAVAVPQGARQVQVRVNGRLAGAELVVMRDRASRQLFGTRAAEAGDTGRARLGRVIPRREWGADERMRNAGPSYNARVDSVVVHHTVNANDYSPAQAPAIVRGVYAYHTRSRGYDDIAYNLLVDRFGRIYEGRYGGIVSGRAVIGSHTMGFNRRTLGVAVIGNIDVAAPSAATVDALARVGAWAADTWRFDPRGTVVLTSRGSTRYRSGTNVRLGRMQGHRDTGVTACPGRYLYPKLPELRARAWRLLAPVIHSVRITGAPVHAPDPLTITAGLTAPASWRIDVIGPYGASLLSTAGRGRALKLQWDGFVDGLPAPPGDYRYTITANDGRHGASTPVAGTFQVGLPRLAPL